MRGLTDAELLRAWETGAHESPGRRALLLLNAAGAELHTDTARPGRRDRLLLDCRARSLGPVLACRSSCPGCGEQLAFDISAAELAAREPTEPSAQIHFTDDGFVVDARFPTCGDLAAVSATGDVYSLARRCIIHLQREGVELSADQAPEPLLDRLDSELAQADSDVRLTLDLTCPGCGVTWEPNFDAVDFVWTEIECRALRLLREVHTLARAYHWSETEILRLGPRRQQYLDLVGA